MKDKILKISSYISEYAVYGLVLFIPISKAAAEIFAGFILFGFIIKKSIRSDFKFLKSWPNLFVALFISFSALSLLNSGPLIGKSLEALFLKWCKYIGMFLMIQDTLTTRKRINTAVTLILMASAVLAIDGFVQKYTGMDFLRHKELMKLNQVVPGIRATFDHYNSFGAYLSVVLSLVCSLLISRKLRSGYKLPISALFILLAGALLLTYSRGSWLGFICALLLMLILSNNPKPFAYLFGMLVFLLMFSSEIRQRAVFTFQSAGDADRFLIWKAAFGMIKEHIFLGKGIGTFMDHFLRYVDTRVITVAQYAHNCYLQIWAESGLFSLLSFLGFLAALFASGIKYFKKSQNYILLGFICALLGFCAHSFFDTHFYSLQLAFLFWTTAGLVAALIRLEINQSREPEA